LLEECFSDGMNARVDVSASPIAERACPQVLDRAETGNVSRVSNH
jgi:hypothetical protein